MIDYSFKLDGIQDEKYQPKEFESLEIQADFDNNSIQPNLTATELTLINDAAIHVNNYIDGALNNTTRGIFEGLPYEILLLSENPPYNAFKGHLDLLAIKRKCDEVKIKLIADEGLANFSERCQALTFGYLESLGYFPVTQLSAVPYVINYIPDGMQVLMIAISLFLMTKEIYDIVPKITAQTTALIAVSTPNIPIIPALTVSVSAIVIEALKLALILAYLVLMIIAIKNLIEQLFTEIYSVKRYHKGCKVKTLLSQACTHLGFTFHSSIFSTGSVFENLVFLPYKTKKGDLGVNYNESGVPSSNAFGYTVYEIFQLCMEMFNAKLLIKNGIVSLESLTNTAFWVQQSTYVFPDVEVLEKAYNTDELNPNYVIKFNYDISDMNTIDSFLGTNYERITSPNSINDVKHLNFGGLKEVALSVCRATRKNSTSNVEDLLGGLAKVADNLINLFGGSSKFLNGFQNRIGAMNVSQHFGWSPKVLLLGNDGKLPTNNSTIVSAKYLYQNYHAVNSFVENNFEGQYEIYKDIIIPFCFHDFLKTIENSYFIDINGNRGKFDKITWNFTQMYAKVDYRLQIPYTKNLKEIFIEPE